MHVTALAPQLQCHHAVPQNSLKYNSSQASRPTTPHFGMHPHDNGGKAFVGLVAVILGVSVVGSIFQLRRGVEKQRQIEKAEAEQKQAAEKGIQETEAKLH